MSHRSDTVQPQMGSRSYVRNAECGCNTLLLAELLTVYCLYQFRLVIPQRALPQIAWIANGREKLELVRTALMTMIKHC